MQEACLPGVGSVSVLGSEAWGISSSNRFAGIQLFALAAGSNKAPLRQLFLDPGSGVQSGLNIKRHYVLQIGNFGVVRVCISS